MAAMYDLSTIKYRPLLSTTLILLVIFPPFSQAENTDAFFTIQEELPINSEVGMVSTQPDIARYLFGNETWFYWLLVYPDTRNNLFDINNTTGMITTKARIDREMECHFETECILKLKIATQNASKRKFYPFSIDIEVEDKNDNSPVFHPSSTTVSIDEDASINTTIPIPLASDNDILENTLQSYRLKTASNVFGLRVSRNLDRTLVPQLYLTSELDRESQQSYLLTVVAMDRGVPSKSGELTINVSVNDVNDNAPMFTQQTYDIEVDEVEPINSRVMTLNAYDLDTGLNGRVR